MPIHLFTYWPVAIAFSNQPHLLSLINHTCTPLSTYGMSEPMVGWIMPLIGALVALQRFMESQTSSASITVDLHSS